MTRKEFKKHYINILHCPDVEKCQEKEDYLKNEIQQLADTIDYRLKALKKLLKDKDRAKKEQDLIEDISSKIKKLSKVQRAKILAMLIK